MSQLLAEFEVALANPQFLNAVPQGRRWYSEPRRGPVRARHSPSTSRECVLNDLPFTTGVLIGVCGLRLLRQADSTGIPGQPGCIHRKHAIRTDNDRPLNNILQFANIARPGIGSKQFDRSFIDLFKVLAHVLGKSMDKVFQQPQNVVLPFAKRGNLDREYVQSVVEVRAKCPVCNGGIQIAISCRNYADIDLDGLRAADTFEFTFLQHPQECNLSVQRQLADFVEENGSSARQFKSTEAALHRPGERALFVAKEFGRNQRWGKSCAVHAHEGALRPTRSLMDRAGDEFLTSSSLSTNKNARIGGSNFRYPRKHSLQRRRGADDLFEHERLVDLLPEHYVFVVQFISQTFNLFKRLLQVGSRAVVFGDIY